MAGVYVHIPFCKSRCIYCDFFSTTSLPLREKYVDALCHEIELRSQGLSAEERRIETIYLGGGTPSQLSIEQLRRIFDAVFDCFQVSEEAEITMEVNPDDVNATYLQGLKQLPVNRLSFGIQTFNDERLRFIRRRHTAQQAINVVHDCQAAGYGNISIDLMFGFPGETLEEWQSDIETALSLNVQHISAYSLMYEEGTALTRMLEAGEIEEIDEELSLQMYGTLVERLKKAGFEHYEISNFARPDRRSRHNSSYWHGIPYFGFGAGAHSYDGHARTWNANDLLIYIKGVETGSLATEGEMLNMEQKYDECVMVGLRTCEGVDLQHIESVFGKQYLSYLLENAQPHLDIGKLCIEQNWMHLTEKGIYTSNDIISDLMRV